VRKLMISADRARRTQDAGSFAILQSFELPGDEFAYKDLIEHGLQGIG
jgi:hypothetical protein